VIRSGWKSARWLDGKGNVFDLVSELRKLEHDVFIRKHSLSF
jgi:hypothetical protein